MQAAAGGGRQSEEHGYHLYKRCRALLQRFIKALKRVCFHPRCAMQAQCKLLSAEIRHVRRHKTTLNCATRWRQNLVHVAELQNRTLHFGQMAERTEEEPILHRGKSVKWTPKGNSKHWRQSGVEGCYGCIHLHKKVH